MLSIFRRTKKATTPPTWWSTSLTTSEQATIENAFQPLGSISAETLVNSNDPRAIGDLVGHLKREHLRHLGYKLLDYADTLICESIPILNRHFYWAARGEFYYRWRDVDDFALDRAVESFQQQIALSSGALKAFTTEKDWGVVPAHAGYRQLRIIEEKRGNLILARSLCEQAKAQGW